MATTLPARRTWCASSWAKSTPATIRGKTGTPVPHNSFGDWRRQGIFLQDAQPSIYLYVQRFTAPGRND